MPSPATNPPPVGGLAAAIQEKTARGVKVLPSHVTAQGGGAKTPAAPPGGKLPLKQKAPAPKGAKLPTTPLRHPAATLPSRAAADDDDDPGNAATLPMRPRSPTPRSPALSGELRDTARQSTGSPAGVEGAASPHPPGRGRGEGRTSPSQGGRGRSLSPAARSPLSPTGRGRGVGREGGLSPASPSLPRRASSPAGLMRQTDPPPLPLRRAASEKGVGGVGRGRGSPVRSPTSPRGGVPPTATPSAKSLCPTEPSRPRMPLTPSGRSVHEVEEENARLRDELAQARKLLGVSQGVYGDEEDGFSSPARSSVPSPASSPRAMSPRGHAAGFSDGVEAFMEGRGELHDTHILHMPGGDPAMLRVILLCASKGDVSTLRRIASLRPASPVSAAVLPMALSPLRAKLRELVKHVPSVDVDLPVYGVPPLLYLCRLVGDEPPGEGRETAMAAIHVLLQCGVNVNVACQGTTPLQTACTARVARLVEMLVAYGARRVEDALTPLMLACYPSPGDVDTAKALLRNGFPVEGKVTDPSSLMQGCTALHLAVLGGDTAMVKALLAHGADPLARSDDSEGFGSLSPLLLCSRFGFAETMKALLAKHPHLLRASSAGATPAGFAFVHGHYRLCDLLLSMGAPADGLPGTSPAHALLAVAVCAGNTAAVLQLSSAFAPGQIALEPLPVPGVDGAIPALQLAVLFAKPAVAQFLLEASTAKRRPDVSVMVVQLSALCAAVGATRAYGDWHPVQPHPHPRQLVLGRDFINAVSHANRHLLVRLVAGGGRIAVVGPTPKVAVDMWSPSSSFSSSIAVHQQCGVCRYCSIAPDDQFLDPLQLSAVERLLRMESVPASPLPAPPPSSTKRRQPLPSADYLPLPRPPTPPAEPDDSFSVMECSSMLDTITSSTIPVKPQPKRRRPGLRASMVLGVLVVLAASSKG